MADIEFWLQIENHARDASPHDIDGISGQTIQQVTQQMFGTAKNPVVNTLISPVTGSMHDQRMFNALSNDALIYRPYTANWAAPDDRKVNPWDQKELDPADSGTMETIPGAVLECNVGDKIIVHFRNTDNRTQSGALLPAETRTHSLHPHGVVFAPTSDGAFPLSPPDTTQQVGGEAAAWASVGVTNFKQGDRVPPGGTYTYTWETHGWPSTAGVWLYHDHSICDEDNVKQGG